MKKNIFAALVLCMSLINAFAQEPIVLATIVNNINMAGEYPLSVCPVSGETLGAMGDAVVKVYDGREVKFCCANCVGTFEKNLKKSFKKLDKAIIENGEKSYPLQTCVGCGDELSAMGKPYAHLYKNQLVMLCCKDCVANFEKDPDKCLSMIDAAAQPVEAETKE